MGNDTMITIALLLLLILSVVLWGAIWLAVIKHTVCDEALGDE